MSTTLTRTTTHPAPRVRRALRGGLAAASLTVLLAACGGGDVGAAVPAEDVDPEHNEADIAFAQQMVPHHEQAVMMSQMAESRAESPEVVELAEQIEAAQGPEVRTMTTFLEVWGAAGPDDMAGHGMEGMDDTAGMEGMAGMMSEEQLDGLGAAVGPDFDRMWLESMIAHHEGAIEMSATEVEDGLNPQAVALAEEIAETQEAEIDLMEDLLADG